MSFVHRPSHADKHDTLFSLLNIITMQNPPTRRGTPHAEYSKTRSAEGALKIRELKHYVFLRATADDAAPRCRPPRQNARRCVRGAMRVDGRAISDADAHARVMNPRKDARGSR